MSRESSLEKFVATRVRGLGSRLGHAGRTIRRVNRWSIVLDPDAGEDTREEAWRALRKRMKHPVLFQLRRRIEGWRLTDKLAAEVLDQVRERFEGKGSGGEAALLRRNVEREIARACEERGAKGGIDEEFERDWASSLFFAALKEYGRTEPENHQIVLLLFDRPEGVPPMTPAELAQRLQQSPEEVERRLEEGRAGLRRLFLDEIAHTVADEARVADEAAQLLPRAQPLLGPA